MNSGTGMIDIHVQYTAESRLSFGIAYMYI